MAVNPLNLLTALRPWRSAGVSHFLADGPVDARREGGAPDAPEPNAPEQDGPKQDAPGRDTRGRDAYGRDAYGPDAFGSGASGPNIPAPNTPSPNVPGPHVSGPAQSAPEASEQGPLGRERAEARFDQSGPGRGGAAVHDSAPAQAPAQSDRRNSPASTAAARVATHPDARHSHAAPARQNRGTAARSSSAHGGAHSAAPVSSDAWPAPWRELLNKVSPAPLLWAYAELARDLLAPTDESRVRSTLLRSLISELNLPKGTSTFWPLLADSAEPAEYAKPGAGDAAALNCDAPVGASAEGPGTSGFLVASGIPVAHGSAGYCADMPFRCSPFFVSGLSVLTPKIVVLFGAEGAGASPAPAFFTQGIVGGRAFVYLPPLADLAGTGSAQNRACVFLRSMLMQFPILTHS